MSDRPTLVNALSAVSDGKLVAVPGGVLIMSSTGQEVVGAMGVSGDTSDKDEVSQGYLFDAISDSPIRTAL